jgi:ribosomal RNA-processing protein 1
MANFRSTSVEAPERTLSWWFRIDKFYLLARRYVAAAFRFLKEEEWSEKFVKEYTEMLSNGPLQLSSHKDRANSSSPKNSKIPNSIRYHITDIFLDELDKVEPLESAEDEFWPIVKKLLEPFTNIRKEGFDKTAKLKVKGMLEDTRLEKANITF